MDGLDVWRWQENKFKLLRRIFTELLTDLSRLYIDWQLWKSGKSSTSYHEKEKNEKLQRITIYHFKTTKLHNGYTVMQNNDTNEKKFMIFAP